MESISWLFNRNSPVVNKFGELILPDKKLNEIKIKIFD